MATLRRLIPAFLLLGALALPAVAPAAVQVHKLKGTFDAESVPGTGTVFVEIVVKNGSPVRVKSIAFKALPARCNVSETPGSPVYEPAGRMSGGAGANRNGDGIEFGRTLQWFSYPAGRQVTMTGKLSKSGKRISNGELQVHNNKSGSCQSAVGRFTAKK